MTLFLPRQQELVRVRGFERRHNVYLNVEYIGARRGLSDALQVKVKAVERENLRVKMRLLQ